MISYLLYTMQIKFFLYFFYHSLPLQMHKKEPRRQASGFFSVGRSVDRFCEEVFFFLFLESGLDVQFFQLLISDYGRCLGERIDRTLGLREGDDIADGVEVEHQHDETVKAEGDACMRRSAVLECIKQEAEFLLCFFLRDTDGFEYFFLQILLVDTKGAAAGFDTVQDIS